MNSVGDASIQSSNGVLILEVRTYNNCSIGWLAEACRMRATKIRRMVQAAALEAVIYFIWQARNQAFSEGKISYIDYSIKRIQARKCEI